jgi:hypothetical protein
VVDCLKVALVVAVAVIAFVIMVVMKLIPTERSLYYIHATP